MPILWSCDPDFNCLMVCYCDAHPAGMHVIHNILLIKVDLKVVECIEVN
jgi:hypothetical protein